MMLQKQMSRRIGDTEYSKWVLVIPPEVIEKAKFREGQEIEAKVKDNKIVLEPKN